MVWAADSQKTCEKVGGMSAPKVSFEFFPPKTPEMEQKLWDCVRRLEPLRPDYVSVTYGAGGSTRERTHDIVRRMAAETSLAPAGHITCVAATRPEIDQVLKDYWDAGVKRIVALARRPDGGHRREVCPASGRLCLCKRPDRRRARRSRTSIFRWAAIRKCIPMRPR